jgi:hypothetical protein
MMDSQSLELGAPILWLPNLLAKPLLGAILTMNINLERNKLFLSPSETQFIVRVTTCLTTCDKCTGMYVDNIRGNIARVICIHKCHSNEDHELPATKDDYDIDFSFDNACDSTTQIEERGDDNEKIEIM